MYIKNKGDLLDIVARQKFIRPAIKRAIENGWVENFGGFDFGQNKGWIIKFYGKVQHWYVKIIPFVSTPAFVGEINTVPWDKWEGDKSNNPLYQGDNPNKYKELKNEQQN